MNHPKHNIQQIKVSKKNVMKGRSGPRERAAGWNQLDRKLDRFRGKSEYGEKEKIPSPAGNRSPTVQPATSHLLTWAPPAGDLHDNKLRT